MVENINIISEKSKLFISENMEVSDVINLLKNNFKTEKLNYLIGEKTLILTNEIYKFVNNMIISLYQSNYEKHYYLSDDIKLFLRIKSYQSFGYTWYSDKLTPNCKICNNNLSLRDYGFSCEKCFTNYDFCLNFMKKNVLQLKLLFNNDYDFNIEQEKFSKLFDSFDDLLIKKKGPNYVFKLNLHFIDSNFIEIKKYIIEFFKLLKQSFKANNDKLISFIESINQTIDDLENGNLKLYKAPYLLMSGNNELILEDVKYK